MRWASRRVWGGFIAGPFVEACYRELDDTASDYQRQPEGVTELDAGPGALV